MGPFSDQVALELRQRSKDVEDEFAVDAQDWYLWKLLDALMASAFEGSGANTPWATPRSSASSASGATGSQ